jgi:hypothetical protein
VYRAHIVAHLELFGAFYRAVWAAAAANADPMALADWPPSPELSDDSVDDGSQFVTPPWDWCLYEHFTFLGTWFSRRASRRIPAAWARALTLVSYS